MYKGFIELLLLTVIHLNNYIISPNFSSEDDVSKSYFIYYFILVHSIFRQGFINFMTTFCNFSISKFLCIENKKIFSVIRN